PIERIDRRTLLAIVHPDDREQVDRILFDSATRREELVDFRILRRDSGDIVWISARGEAVQVRSDSTVFLVVAFNVTERKRVEMALAVNETRLRAVTDSIDTMIWSATADGYSDYFNQRWYDFTG